MELVPSSRFGGASPTVQQASALHDIAATLQGVALSRDGRIATYELNVTNNSGATVGFLAYAASSKAAAPATYSTTLVPAFSSLAVTLDVTLPPRARADRVIFELRGENLRLSLDAAVPAKTGSSWRRALAAACGLIVVALAIAGSALKPHVVALAAPSSVVAGQPFGVAYASRGPANVSYTIETPDGLQVRSGTLDQRSDSFAAQVPVAPATQAYDVRVVAANRFGVDARQTRILAMPAAKTRVITAPAVARQQPAAPQATPSSVLTLAHDTVSGGKPIVAHFLAGAATGTARLIDQNGATRATALLRSDGSAILVAPVVPVDQEFRVAVQVQKGNYALESDAGVLVKANGRKTPAGSVPPAHANADPNSPFAIGSAPVHAGSPLPITVLRHERGLRIALTGPAGNEISAVNVPSAAHSVDLKIPRAARAEDDLLLATFTRGSAQETVVQPVHVMLADGTSK